ncbi:cilia- and flagella-associated protein 45 isoform X2 [Paramormyrops kingsleyae]|uniref:cilia- and flagella-associated protein 45 isoform X2 n=1 Tax=Paramormyrops kingsleyae TaxID=1676925 RepID=UPI000CD627A9|nr:cilia- and flagella-associated protein 45 isoform X1 [Paramormyrops kingsleyae]
MPQSLRVNSTRQSGGSHSRRYHTRAPISHVDEMLFGSPQKMCAHDDQDKLHCSGPVPVQKKKTPETIRIITKDLIRSLKCYSRVPGKDPSGLSVILHPSEMNRIMEESQTLSKQERGAILEAKTKERQKAMDSAEDRKVQIRLADMSRKKNQGLSDLEAEAQQRAQYLLEKANEMRMEQEDEVKKLNTLIVGAQCQAVLDAQIAEKHQIHKELQEEERRLDAMMEVDRRQALEEQDHVNELNKRKRVLGKLHIVKQIQEQLDQRMLQDEVRAQEGEQILKDLEKLQMEELQTLQRRREDQRQLLLEIQKINEQSLRAKECKKEEEKLADLHALEYTRQKMEREAEYEAEQQRIKKEKEKEVAQLRALQERERDHRAEQDELRARRNQEAAEREWRKREKEQARKKVEEQERLKAERQQQIMQKERLLSIEAGRNRAEFERVLRAQQEAIAHEQQRDGMQKRQAMRCGEEIQQQMREREVLILKKRGDLLQESKRIQEESRHHQAQLELMMQRKLRDLKAAGLPDKYCNQVERKARILPPLTH